MKISEKKKEKISEQILLILFQANPKMLFTSEIASEMARDEEFTKGLLSKLKKKGLVVEVNKNKEGTPYLRRTRWKISDKVYSAYKTALG